MRNQRHQNIITQVGHRIDVGPLIRAEYPYTQPLVFNLAFSLSESDLTLIAPLVDSHHAPSPRQTEARGKHRVSASVVMPRFRSVRFSPDF